MYGDGKNLDVTRYLRYNMELEHLHTGKKYNVRIKKSLNNKGFRMIIGSKEAVTAILENDLFLW